MRSEDKIRETEVFVMQPQKSIRKIPVILDTDIGGDIDDTWALVMILNSPELDLNVGDYPGNVHADGVSALVEGKIA